MFFHSVADPNRIIHIGYCINEELMIEAAGGGSDTTTLQKAIEKNAFIQINPINSRTTIHGYVDPFKE